MLDRILNNGGEAALGSSPHNDDELSLCRQRFMEAEKELEAEKKRGLVLKTLLNCNVGDNNQFCLKTHIGGLGMDELEQMTSDIEQLQKNVEKRAHEMMNNVPVQKKKKRIV
ncbi:hypothetical protein MKW92_010056 [Papaver armeniacum]|nr:hypothetical protein MKW92_010056 [Papaver armeniacum]